MTLRPVFLWICCLALSVAFTGGIYFMDHAARSRFQEQYALKLAEQTVAQIVSLTEAAKEAGERNPVGWAALQLNTPSAGVLVRAYPARVDIDQALAHFSADTGELDFAKKISDDDAMGVRVRVKVPPVRFAGLENRGQVAGAFLVLVCAFCMAAWAVTRSVTERMRFFVGARAVVRRHRKHRKSDPSALNDWIHRFKQIVAAFGVHLRSVLKDTRDLIAVLIQDHSAWIEVSEKTDSFSKKIDVLSEQLRQLKKGAKKKDIEFMRTVREIEKELESMRSDASEISGKITESSARVSEWVQKTGAMTDHIHHTNQALVDAWRKLP